VQQIWHSQIVIGTMTFDQQAWDEWLVSGGESASPFARRLAAWTGLRAPDGGPWTHLCARQAWVPKNLTLHKLVVTGPEDPKIFQRQSQIDLAFSSYPPTTGANSSNSGCGENPVGQMFYASGVDPAAPTKEALGMHIQCHLSGRAEKNWIPFEYKGQIHFVYSIYPHTVIAVDQHGQCTKNPNTISLFDPIRRIQTEHHGWEFRGSAQALYIDDPEVTPNIQEPHYLALFHVVDVKTKRYAHFAYRFSAHPPFHILQVSSQLPLQTARAEGSTAGVPFAFVSSLAVNNRLVIISYTAGDRDSRALFLTLWKLDSLFGTRAAEQETLATAALSN
jgi:hypothetical protein